MIGANDNSQMKRASVYMLTNASNISRDDESADLSDNKARCFSVCVARLLQRDEFASDDTIGVNCISKVAAARTMGGDCFDGTVDDKPIAERVEDTTHTPSCALSGLCMLDILAHKLPNNLVVVPDRQSAALSGLSVGDDAAEHQGVLDAILSDANPFDRFFVVSIGRRTHEPQYRTRKCNSGFLSVFVNIEESSEGEHNLTRVDRHLGDDYKIIELNLYHAHDRYVHDTDFNYIFELLVFRFVRALQPQAGVLHLDLDAILGRRTPQLDITPDSLAFIVQRLYEISPRLSVFLKCAAASDACVRSFECALRCFRREYYPTPANELRAGLHDITKYSIPLQHVASAVREMIQTLCEAFSDYKVLRDKDGKHTVAASAQIEATVSAGHTGTIQVDEQYLTKELAEGEAAFYRQVYPRSAELHPYLPRVHDVFERDGRAYVKLENLTHGGNYNVMDIKLNDMCTHKHFTTDVYGKYKFYVVGLIIKNERGDVVEKRRKYMMKLSAAPFLALMRRFFKFRSEAAAETAVRHMCGFLDDFARVLQTHKHNPCRSSILVLYDPVAQALRIKVIDFNHYDTKISQNMLANIQGVKQYFADNLQHLSA